MRRDASLVAGGQLLAVASGFLLTVVGARLLPQQEFGALSWALSWLAWLSVVAQLGLTQVATVSLAGAPARDRSAVLRRLLAAQAVGLLLVVPVWWLLLGPAAAVLGDPPGAYRPLVALTALWLPAATVGPVVVNALRARGRFGLAVVFGEHVRRVVLVGVLVAAALVATETALGPVVAWAVALETAVTAVALLVLLRLVRSPQGRPDPSPDDPPTTWGLLRAGSGFTVATLASVTVPQAGVWLLAAFAPAEEVAVFSVAVRIALLVGTPTAVVMRTLAPRVVAAHRAGTLLELEETIRRLTLGATVVTALAVLVLGVGGSRLLAGVFGEGYGAALPATLVLCVGALVNAWTGPCSVVLSHAGRQGTVAASALVSSLAFVALAAWWAPAAQGLGVAAAAAVAMSVRNLHLARAVHRTLGVRTIAALTPRR